MAIPSFISFKLNTNLVVLKIKYDYISPSKQVLHQVSENVPV